MALITSDQFEALWQSAQSQPVRPVATQPIQVDLSLSGILTQYLAMAQKYRDSGKISIVDHEELTVSVTALKTILARINDAALIADAMTQNAGALQQRISGKNG